MVERSRNDSSRDLLEELEDGWGTPRPPPASEPKTAEPISSILADRESSPDLDKLDEGWLDDLFPGDEKDEEDEEDEDEAEESEPELPDAELDPEAYARAKKEREERAAKKKDKRRAKAEAKRARQKARALAMRQKQKAKKGRPARPPTDDAPAKRSEKASSPRLADNGVGDDGLREEEAADIAAAGVVVAKQRAKVTKAAAPSTKASLKLLAIVLATLLALAAAAAAILK